MPFYVAATIAMRNEFSRVEIGYGVTSFIVTGPASHQQIDAIALEMCKESYPPNEGWYGHETRVAEICQDALRKALQE